jgi:hypothetical protein
VAAKPAPPKPSPTVGAPRRSEVTASAAPASVTVPVVVPAVPSMSTALADDTSPIPSPSSMASAGHIALDRDHVYWIDQPETQVDPLNPSSRLLMAPRPGKSLHSAPIVLATISTSVAVGIAVDGTSVYFARAGTGRDGCRPGKVCSGSAIHALDGEIVAVAKAGAAAPRVIVGGLRDPKGVAVDAKYIYWADGEGLYRAEKVASGSTGGLGGRTTMLHSGVRCHALAIDAESIYCLANPIIAVPLAGGASRVVSKALDIERHVLERDKPFVALAVDERNVYFSSISWFVPDTSPVGQRFGGPNRMRPGPRQLSILPKTGGSHRPLVFGEDPDLIVADASHAYWTDGNQVRAVSLRGGKPQRIASEGALVRGLAIDESRVYWVAQGEFASVAKR